MILNNLLRYMQYMLLEKHTLFHDKNQTLINMPVQYIIPKKKDLGCYALSLFFIGGWGRNRTADTRIFNGI